MWYIIRTQRIILWNCYACSDDICLKKLEKLELGNIIPIEKHVHEQLSFSNHVHMRLIEKLLRSNLFRKTHKLNIYNLKAKPFIKWSKDNIKYMSNKEFRYHTRFGYICVYIYYMYTHNYMYTYTCVCICYID